MGKKIVGFKANKRCAAVCDDSPLHLHLTLWALKHLSAIEQRAGAV